MRNTLLILLFVLDFALLGGAIFTMIKQVDGWGWIVFCLLLSIYYTYDIFDTCLYLEKKEKSKNIVN